jgi:hypothetical protein
MKYETNLRGFQRFDIGTVYTILGKPKFVLLDDEVHNKKSIPKMLLKSLSVYNFSIVDIRSFTNRTNNI